MLLKKIIHSRIPLSYDVPHIARLYAQICKYYNYEISPHLGFGLGVGLSFEYIRTEDYRLSPDFIVREKYFGGCFSKDRRRLARNLRIWLDVYRGNNMEKAFTSYSNMIKQGIPLIVEVDLKLYYHFLKLNHRKLLEKCKNLEQIYNIPPNYYINAYSVILIGIEDETNAMVCLDANLEEPIVIPYQTFMEMHSHRTDYINTEYEWIDILIPKHKKLMPPEYAILEAIREDVNMLESPVNFQEDYILGIAGMKRLYKDAVNREGIFTGKLIKESAQKIYYTSEVLYGKTGLYRKTYSDFLMEAGKYYPSLIHAAKRYAQLAGQWSNLLYSFKDIDSVDCLEGNFLQVLEDIIHLEEEACCLLRNSSEKLQCSVMAVNKI